MDFYVFNNIRIVTVSTMYKLETRRRTYNPIHSPLSNNMKMIKY